MKQIWNTDIRQLAKIAFGNLLFAIGLNLFIVPLGLYSGGLIGFAQILRTMFVDVLNLPIPSNVDIAGIVNLLLNIPLFILAFRSISRKFFVKTVLSVIVQTIFLTMIIIPETAIIEDVLAACLIGGIICGVGIGLTLQAGACGGGVDILGMYFSMRKPGASVGKIYVIANVFVFGLCALLFEVPVAIYSIIYAVCMSQAMDRVHYQNINMTAMIFTKKRGIAKGINEQMRRGVTYWKGAGAYTNEDTFILVTAISKYEVNTLNKIIHEVDPQAFVIFNEGMQVSGNFEKRL